MSIAVPNPRRKSEFTLRLEADWDQMPLKVACNCGGFEREGPAGEVREAIREHRRVEHPDRPLYAKRPKRPPKKRHEQNAEDKKILADLAGRKNGRNGQNGKVTSETDGRVKIREADLRRLYLDEYKNMATIARELGVRASSVRTAMIRYGVPRRDYDPRDMTYITPAREQAAWHLYEQGHTGSEIASVAFQLWGYTTVRQCRRSLYEAFARNQRATRRPIKRLKGSYPEFDPKAALAILLTAEKEAE